MLDYQNKGTNVILPKASPQKKSSSRDIQRCSRCSFAVLFQALQFEAVFQKRLLEHLGAPHSQRRSNARRKTHGSPRRRKVSSTSRKGAARQQPASKLASGSQQSKLS
ncbi:unnamed protein product [Boreogadus saida]